MEIQSKKTLDVASPILFPFMAFFNFLSLTTYGIPFAFYSGLCSSKGVSSSLTGVIFGMFPLGSLLSGLIIGKTLHLYKKKYLVIISQFLIGSSFLGLGLSSYVDNDIYFIVIGLISQLALGLAIGGFITSLYSLVPDYWPKDLQRRIGILEMSVGLGVGIGPLIGAGLFYLNVYILIYAIPSLVVFVCAFFISPFVLPSKNSQELKQTHNLSLVKTYFHKGVIVTLFVLILNYGNLTFLMPIFENHINDMGGSSSLAAYLIGISQVGYLIGVAYIVFSKTEKRKRLFSMALLLNVIACVMIAFPNYYLIGGGMILLGLSNSFTNIPDIPENISFLMEIFPKEEESLISDMASGIYITSISFAQFLGPILGGIFVDLINFHYSMILYGAIVFVYFFYYLWFMKRSLRENKFQQIANPNVIPEENQN